MTNTEQLKVGDRVMLLPSANSVMNFCTPFTIAEVYHIGHRTHVGIKLSDKEYLATNIKNVQPLPTKFDGWEEE